MASGPPSDGRQVAAAPAGPLRARTFRAVVAALVLPLLFVAAFTIPGHYPQPNDLPVAVVGEAPPGLADRGFEIVRSSGEAAAAAAVRDREAYGALLPDRTVVASGASAAVAGILQEVRPGIRVEDVAPLADGDPRGVSLNLLVLPIIITSILSALLTMQLVPDLKTRVRIPVIAGVGLLAGAGVIAIVKALDALPGAFLAEAGLVGLAVLAIASIASALIRLIGPPGILVSFLVFLVIGNPASGLASARELLPTPWSELGGLLPPGALGDTLRGAAYFDGAGVPEPVLVLFAWAAVGVALHLVADRRAGRG